MPSIPSNWDVIVVGGGAAGLMAALELPEGLSVLLLSKDRAPRSASRWAQGGIAAVTRPEDSFASHLQDTLKAGGDLCDRPAVELLVREAPACVERLLELGMDFDRHEGGLSTTLEAAHSHRRVLHAQDRTGGALVDALERKVLQRPGLQRIQGGLALQLWISDGHCRGLQVLVDGTVQWLQARAVVLATGGAAHLFANTTNPKQASGDGIAMAWRAGCRIANMEFNQFHPTCLYHPKAKSFLITEALRGEGGQLKLPDGTRFMQDYDPRGELAPRDIVARAIDSEMKRLGCSFVYLDISHKPDDFILEHFPTIHEKCLEYGIDITREKIPVVPAAHYSCGGVMVDLNGKTDVENVYAIGETSCTGLHGANRMASNSLLECFVFAFAAAEEILARLDSVALHETIPAWDESKVTDSDEDVVIAHNWDEIRRCMWDYVGIVRTNKRLQRAQNRIDLLQQEIRWYYSRYRVSRNLLELRNLALVAELIIRSAMTRKESRGLHYTLDYPARLPEAKNTILTPGNFMPVADG